MKRKKEIWMNLMATIKDVYMKQLKLMKKNKIMKSKMLEELHCCLPSISIFKNDIFYSCYMIFSL